MAKRRIIWSERAKKTRYQILQFYITRNKNKTYSKKLNNQINQKLQLLINYPKLGIKTDIPYVRGLILDNFIIYYEFDKELIRVLYIWDSRQDPEKLVVK